MTHVPQYCSVKDCTEESTHWLQTWTGATFHVCDEHMQTIAGFYEDGSIREVIYMPNVLTGTLGETEIGVYSCSDECDQCN
jgi:hypothetical protein